MSAQNGRRIVFLSLCVQLLATSISTAQPEVNWWRAYSAPGNLLEQRFADIYSIPEGGFALCGTAFNPPGLWLVVIDEAGNETFNVHHPHPNGQSNDDVGLSVIQTDNGDFALGGESSARGGSSEFSGALINPEGELLWYDLFGEGFRQSTCAAVIELKAGDLLFAGWVMYDNLDQDGYLVMTDIDGNVRWAQTYGTGDNREQFRAMREVADEGVVIAGRRWNPNTQNFDFWLVKVDFEGELIWEQQYEGEAKEWLTGMASCQGGFALVGAYRFQQDNFWVLKRVDRRGNLQWSETYDFIGVDPGEISTYCAGIVRMPDDGFAIYGTAFASRPQRGICAGTTPGGELVWARADLIEGARVTYGGAVAGEDGAIALVGSWDDGELIGRRGHQSGVLVKLWAEHNAPVIVRWSPREFSQTVLAGDSINFIAVAEDHDDDTLYYQWRLNGDLVGEDTSVTIRFPEIGRDTADVVVTDSGLTDRLRWHIAVRDLFVASHTPDTLDLSIRRGRTLDFSITIAAVEGGPVNYQWTLANLDNPQPEVVSEDRSVSLEFLRSGNYALEAFASRGESSDAVTWTISVRGAVWSFWPGQLSLTVPPDTLINFGVIPFNRESDSLSYAWYFGEDLLGMDSTVDVRFGREGRTQVTAVVADGAEVDTLLWNVLVQPLDAIGGDFILHPSSFILSASPNPFNSSTTIRFTLPRPEVVRLSLYDLGGRQVAELVDGRLAAGVHSAAFDGGSYPAGIYLVRLQAGDVSRTAKLGLVK